LVECFCYPKPDLRDSANAIVGATPGFPAQLVPPAHFMRLSLKKAAYAVASSAAYRKSGSPHRYRPRYALANLGHPSHSFGLCYDTNSVGTLLDQFVLTNGNRAPSVVAALKPAACPTARGGQAGRAKEGLPAVVGGSGRALCSEGVGRGLVRLAQLFVDGHVVVDLRVLQGGAS